MVSSCLEETVQESSHEVGQLRARVRELEAALRAKEVAETSSTVNEVDESRPTQLRSNSLGHCMSSLEIGNGPQPSIRTSPLLTAAASPAMLVTQSFILANPSQHSVQLPWPGTTTAPASTSSDQTTQPLSTSPGDSTVNTIKQEPCSYPSPLGSSIPTPSVSLPSDVSSDHPAPTSQAYMARLVPNSSPQPPVVVVKIESSSCPDMPLCNARVELAAAEQQHPNLQSIGVATTDATATPSFKMNAQIVHASSAPSSSIGDQLLNPQGASKQCQCKKSRCLKLYCECFAANVFCNGCKCTDCHNVPEHADERLHAIRYKLSRRPRAFEPKFTASTAQDAENTPVLVKNKAGEMRHSRGCNCKKSGCNKRYCECFQNGVACSSICKCTRCENRGSKSASISGMSEWKIPLSAKAVHAMGTKSQVQRPVFPADFIPGQEPTFTFVPHGAQSNSPPPCNANDTDEFGHGDSTQKSAAQQVHHSSRKRRSVKTDASVTSTAQKHRRLGSTDSLSSPSPDTPSTGTASWQYQHPQSIYSSSNSQGSDDDSELELLDAEQDLGDLGAVLFVGHATIENGNITSPVGADDSSWLDTFPDIAWDSLESVKTCDVGIALEKSVGPKEEVGMLSMEASIEELGMDDAHSQLAEMSPAASTQTHEHPEVGPVRKRPRTVSDASQQTLCYAEDMLWGGPPSAVSEDLSEDLWISDASLCEKQEATSLEYSLHELTSTIDGL